MRRALVVALLASLATPAAAQAPAGWAYHAQVVSGMRVAVACAGDAAYLRDWSGNVARWDGSSFTPLRRIPRSPYGDRIAASADGQVFSLAGGGVAHWDGAAWNRLETAPDTGELHGLWVSDAARAYFVSRRTVHRQEGAGFGAYDAGTWRDLDAIWGHGRELWTAGQGGTVMHHDGAGWSRQAPDTEEWLRGLAGSGPRDLWAWSDREIFHFDGSAWESRTGALAGAVRAVATTGDQTVAVGAFGLARFDAGRWSTELTNDQLGEGYHEVVDACFTDRHLVVADNGGHAWIRAR